MKIVEKYRNGEFVFDNLKDNHRVEILIENNRIRINFQNIIDTQFTGGNIGDDFYDLREFMRLGKYDKAPCGGFVNFNKVISDEGKNYIIFSGVKEISNSYYLVTVHCILGL